MNTPALSRSFIDLDTGCRQFVHVPSLLREGTTEVFAVSDKRRVLMEIPKGVSAAQGIPASRSHIDAPLGSGYLHRLGSEEREILGQIQSWDERFNRVKPGI